MVHENVVFQIAEGVVDESAGDGYGLRGAAYYETPLCAPLWSTIKDRFHPDFIAAFEAEYDLEPRP